MSEIIYGKEGIVSVDLQKSNFITKRNNALLVIVAKLFFENVHSFTKK